MNMFIFLKTKESVFFTFISYFVSILNILLEPLYETISSTCYTIIHFITLAQHLINRMRIKDNITMLYIHHKGKNNSFRKFLSLQCRYFITFNSKSMYVFSNFKYKRISVNIRIKQLFPLI